MKQIPLTQGKFTLVDDEDYEYLNQFKWFAMANGNNFYATRKVRNNKIQRNVYMHRLILSVTDTKHVIDHIDHNSLNNQKSNLRIASHIENCKNRKPKKGGGSKYLGVYYFKAKTPRWQASMTVNKKSIYIGLFKSEDEAALAYNEAATKHHGQFANLNIIEKIDDTI